MLDIFAAFSRFSLMPCFHFFAIFAMRLLFSFCCCLAAFFFMRYVAMLRYTLLRYAAYAYYATPPHITMLL